MLHIVPVCRDEAEQKRSPPGRCLQWLACWFSDAAQHVHCDHHHLDSQERCPQVVPQHDPLVRACCRPNGQMAVRQGLLSHPSLTTVTSEAIQVSMFLMSLGGQLSYVMGLGSP